MGAHGPVAAFQAIVLPKPSGKDLQLCPMGCVVASELDRSETKNRIRCWSAVLARAPDVRRSFPAALRLPLSVLYVHARMIMITILDGDIRAAKIRKCVLLQGQKKTNKIDGDMNITVTEVVTIFNLRKEISKIKCSFSVETFVSPFPFTEKLQQLRRQHKV